jgi:hypothetical protein
MYTSRSRAAIPLPSTSSKWTGRITVTTVAATRVEAFMRMRMRAGTAVRG